METAVKSPPVDREKRFDWPLCYYAEAFVQSQLDDFLAHHSFARELARRMSVETGTLFFDWVDHLVSSPECAGQLESLGFEKEKVEAPPGQEVVHHPAAMLPRFVLENSASEGFRDVALKVDDVAQFLMLHRRTDHKIEGDFHSGYRRAVAVEENGRRLWVVERRGYRGFLPQKLSEKQLALVSEAESLWKERPRVFEDDSLGFGKTLERLDRVIGMVGQDMACHLVFKVEREYWEKRNWAGLIQKARQDRLGLGWANHDHHTFRSSRKNFLNLMKAHEKLGFHRRERYYTGAAAGWGAQILEQPVEGIVTFCDVDLLPDETEIDFSRQPLPESSQLGTIGLWVGLHGESFLDAGMHHLEARFDYTALREQLAGLQVKTMNPFSDFPFLKQAFTEGERWPVSLQRAQRLLDKKWVTKEQFEKFLAEGAIGSHLENLQRKGGFKGFNQKSVSVIIQATDPRAVQKL